MDDHFAAMDVAEIREHYWGEDKNDFYDLEKQKALDKQAKDISRQLQEFDDFFDPFMQLNSAEELESKTRQLQTKVIAQESTAASHELQFDHYGIESQWRLNDGPKDLLAYSVGQRLELEIGFPDSACPAMGSALLVEVLQLLGQPWMSGCVMLVKCIQSPHPEEVDRRSVLKIVDPRFCMLPLPADTSICALQRYVDTVICGRADESRSELLNQHGGPVPFDWWHIFAPLTHWQSLLTRILQAHAIARTEVNAYRRLQDLQGYHIPTLYHEVRTLPWAQVPTSASDLVRCYGLLIEYIEGDTLATFSHSKTMHSPKVYEEAIRACNILEYYGFNHESIAGRNIIVRREPKADGSRIVMIDLYRHRILNKAEGYGKYSEYWSPETMLQSEDCDNAENFPEHMFTGRMSEPIVFNRSQSYFFTALCHRFDKDDTEISRAINLAKIRFRVIMDDIWQIDGRPILDRDLEQKVLLSQVAYKIIQEERGTSPLMEEEWQTWHLRALPRIAARLGYKTDGLLGRFDYAVQKYVERPNTPKLPREAIITFDTSPSTIATKTSDDVDSSTSGTNGFTSSTSSSALTSSSSNTSIEFPSLNPDTAAHKNVPRVFIPDSRKWGDYDSLEMELRTWLEQKLTETMATSEEKSHGA